jgi:hypothetical protein
MNEEDYYIQKYLYTRDQSAEIGLNIVLSCLRMRSLGRYRPYTDPLSISSNEIMVFDRVKGRLLAVCVSVAFASRRIAPPHVRFSFSFSTLPGSLRKLALGAVVDPTDGLLRNGWLVPAEEMKTIKQVSIGQGKWRATVRLTSKDIFERWNCRSARELVERFGEV